MEFESNETLNLVYLEPKSSSSFIHPRNDTTLWVSDENMPNCFLESSDISVARCAPETDYLEAVKLDPKYLAEPIHETNSSASCIDCSLQESCLLIASDQEDEIDLEPELEQDFDEFPTYVSQLPDVRKPVQDMTVDKSSIKPSSCRSLYKYLLKSVSKRLGKKPAKPQSVDPKPINSRPPRVYAHNHKREQTMVNLSTNTVAYLVNRKSNFYAANVCELASPLGMKNFEWNRLNCGEFFSYNV